MPEVHGGREALGHIERALGDRPIRDGTTLKSAAQCLADYRDRCIARHRQDGGTRWRATLERINAVISVVLAAQFPLGEVPWAELDKARGWLVDIVRDDAADQSPRG